MPKYKKASQSLKPEPKTSTTSATQANIRISGARLQFLYIAAALLAITFGAYSNSFRAGFSLDNNPLILQDPRVQSATWENVSLIIGRSAWWMPPEKGLYRPLTSLTYLFNYAVLGNADRPEGYHYINFLIHFVNVLLCYALALHLLKKKWPAFFVAALWAVHPVLTESVTNIVGRADLLAGFGVLSGLLMYIKSRESTGSRQIAWLAGLMLATGVGIFSKESGIAIVGVIVLYEIVWRSERGLRNLLYGIAATSIPIVAFLIQRSIVLARSTIPVFPYVDNPLLGARFFAARLTALKVLAKYIWLFICPAKLSWNYYFAEIPVSRGTIQDWIAWTVVAAAIVGAWFAYRRNRTVFFLLGLAFVALVPVSNLIILIGSIMAERFLYVPAIGIAACVVMGIYALGDRLKMRMLAPIVLAVVIASLGIRTWSRNLDWKDNTSLLESGVRTTPESFASHFALATHLYLSDSSHANLDRVIEEAEKSLSILDPLPDAQNFEDAYANAGTYYQLKGDLLRKLSPDGQQNISAESIKSYQRALQILLRGASIGRSYDEQMRAKEMARGKSDAEVPHTGSKSLYPELALTYLRLGDIQKSHEAIQQALLVDPEQPKTFVTLARIFLTENKNDDAAVALVESYMSSGDRQILGPLAELYRGGLDAKGCAVSQGADGFSLNTFCEPVHNHICRAKADLLRIYAAAHRRDLSDDLKSRTASDSSCPETPQK